MALIESANARASTDTYLWEGRYPEKIGASRLIYLDNLRSLVILLVIVVHSASTYSGIAKWYYQEVSYAQLTFVDFAVYGTISSYAQAWFMGLMFFIAAYWAAKSLPKHGAAAFMKGRLLRLGVPLLFYDLVIAPFIIIVIVADGIERSFEAICYNYFFYIKTFDWANSAGPLWFAEALLIFCAIYTLYRKFRPQQMRYKANWLNAKMLGMIIVAIALASFAIRCGHPMEYKTHVFMFGFFPGYIALFVLGILAGERGALDQIASAKNIKLCPIVILTCVPLWLFIMLFGGATQGLTFHGGGFTWQSLLYTLWEACFAVLFNIGLIALFKKYADKNNWLTRLFAENSYGIYMFHSMFAVICAMLMKDIAIYTLIKFLVLIVVTPIVTLIFTSALRRIRFVKAILK